MTAQHTPGPWVATGYKNTIVNDANGNTLCMYPGDSLHGTVEQVQANARLIAAAPLMLAALRAIEDAMGFAQGDILTGDYELADGKVSEARHAARAAIRAATGEDA